MRAFYFGGYRLIEEGQSWQSTPSRGTEVLNTGVRRIHGQLDPYSANFSRGLRVECRRSLVETFSDMARDDTLDAELMQLEERLIVASTAAQPVTRVPNDARTMTVNGTFPAGVQPVNVGVPGGGWSPLPGRLVLFGNPSTGYGFVTTVMAYSSGVLTANLEQQVGIGWNVFDAVAYFPDCVFSRMDHGGISVDQRTDEWRPVIGYEFRTTAAGVWAADHQIPPPT